MPVVGRVAEIWRYPFKSMRGERLQKCRVGDNGLWGDRGWALKDRRTGKNASAKRLAGLMLCAAAYVEEPSRERNPTVEITLPDGARLRSDDPGAAERLSEYAGEELALDAMPGAHFDAYPIHLLTTASLETLARLNPAARFDVRRFRPNFLIEPVAGGGPTEGFVELGWLGSDLRIGGAAVLAKKPTVRCVMTTLPQEELPKDLSVLETIVSAAGNNLGVYAAVLSDGEVAVGDKVELL